MIELVFGGGENEKMMFYRKVVSHSEAAEN